MVFDSALLCKKTQSFFGFPLPRRKGAFSTNIWEPGVHVTAATDFPRGLGQVILPLAQNYTMHGMDEGRLQKVIPFFAQGMLPHQGEAKIIARH